MSAERVKLTATHRKMLTAVQINGPGPCDLTALGRTPAVVSQLVSMGFLETLNRLRPGPPVYEITPAGRAVLESARP